VPSAPRCVGLADLSVMPPEESERTVAPIPILLQRVPTKRSADKISKGVETTALILPGPLIELSKAVCLACALYHVRQTVIEEGTVMEG